MLSALPDGIFQDSLNWDRLFLGYNQIKYLDADAFVGLSKLKQLKLNDNLLSTLPNGIFRDLSNLQLLLLQRNNLTYLSEEIFIGLGKLKELRISVNFLSELPNGLFQDLSKLEIIHLPKNQLRNLPQDIFTPLQSLQVLVLQWNELHDLSPGLFHGLTNLGFLALGNNRLTNLPNDIFEGLINLKYLFLVGNGLVQVGNNVFKGLDNLQRLILSNNSLSLFDYDVFNDTHNLAFLDLSANELNAIPNIEPLINLKLLDLTNNTLLWIDDSSFSSLSGNVTLLVSQHEVCQCYVPSYVNCSAADNRSPYLTCDRLLSDRALVIVMWLIGLGAISGNLFVLVWRRKEAHRSKVNSILLRNLAASDLLMGIYMLIIASADIYFGNNFPMQSESWRSGITCRIVGAFSIISSEASVLFVTLISIDRFIAIKFPYSTRKLGKHSVKIVGTVIWTTSIVLGIVPSVLSSVSFKFYDNSHVCIGLPLSLTKIYVTEKTTYKRQHYFEEATLGSSDDIFTTQYKGLSNGLFYSTALFLGLNCVCYFIIVGCYFQIVRAVRESSKQSGRSQEMKEQIRLTTKVTTIVATDFCCWFPIILLGILVQARVIELPPSVYAWCVTFVLPINSAINPYLYTITEVASKYRKKESKNRPSKERSKKQKQTAYSVSDTTQSTQM